MAANGASHVALVRVTSVRTSRCWLWAMSMGVTETERPLALPAQALGGRLWHDGAAWGLPWHLREAWVGGLESQVRSLALWVQRLGA